MSERAFATLVGEGSFFEGPRWHDGRWWASDMYRHTVWAVTPDGRQEAVVRVEGQPSGLGWMPDGSLLISSMRTRQVLRREPSGTVAVHADLAATCPGHLNDLVVDTRGRAYVGNFGYSVAAGDPPTPTVLVKVDPDGSATVVAEDLEFPNGAVITPDGGTLIVAETMAGRLSAFTVLADGRLVDRRPWAELGARSSAGGARRVGPDGCCLDAEGHVWVADAFGRRCLLVAEGGEILDQIPGPGGLGLYACALGGPGGRTLLLCAAPNFSERQRVDASNAVLLTTPVEVPGAGLA